ncbi:hypothetical protein V6N12_050318 [Hibiscus sabdariffa]|uniref:Uncharacterized protein n=1 Tax=Hibiscus sabdariffa TaxID=183260 RepID=A0ABR2GC36_9ROSI
MPDTRNISKCCTMDLDRRNTGRQFTSAVKLGYGKKTFNIGQEQGEGANHVWPRIILSRMLDGARTITALNEPTYYYFLTVIHATIVVHIKNGNKLDRFINTTK